MAFCPEGAAAFPDARAYEVPAAFPLAWDHADARKDAQVPRRDVDAAHPASLAPAVADESAAQDAVRLDVRAKCQAEARDCLLAMDLDFQKVSAVC